MEIIMDLKKHFLTNCPDQLYCTLRIVENIAQSISVRQNILSPVGSSQDRGFMITVIDGKGSAYAASSDLSEKGLVAALHKAMTLAKDNQKVTLIENSKLDQIDTKGSYHSQVEQPWDAVTLKDKIDMLHTLNRSLRSNDHIIDWSASLEYQSVDTWFFTNKGGDIHQHFDYLIPNMGLTAEKEGIVQDRDLGYFSIAMQGGMEVLQKMDFNHDSALRLGTEALELIAAPNCPQGEMDLLLDPGQMALQIHESIGHPLEMDRILGDERNYAGTSFVTEDMFGSFQYGSELLNIVYDPTVAHQFASYDHDDEGFPAHKKYLIEKGTLKRALGSSTSSFRSGVEGVANSRASSWNRAPIDRMANLNLEPGESALTDMIASVERGVYMKTNRSWSIDDSRNKFQFGCQWGQMIENGELTHLVRNPNYRGISRSFWRNLKMLGNKDTFKIYGIPYCGKGEPNQAIFVGHASPAALFSHVSVFGGV